MRTVAAAAALVLAGCSQLLGIDELVGPCTIDLGCGDGQVCDMSAPGGAVCIDREGDLDNDGLTNAMDFCHHRPGGRFDEDRDGLGDECDPCPIARPPSTPDPDGDTVDRPCDPEPAIAGDQISAFDGFNIGLPLGWQVVGPWVVRGGEAVIAPPDGSNVFSLTAPLPLLSAHVGVLGQYRVDAVDGASTQNKIGVTAIDRRPAGVTIITCGGARAAGIDTLLLDTDTGANSIVLPDLFDPASLYQVAERIDSALGACAILADDREGAVQEATGGERATEGGIFVRGVTARFQYVLVIQRRP